MSGYENFWCPVTNGQDLLLMLCYKTDMNLSETFAYSVRNMDDNNYPEKSTCLATELLLKLCYKTKMTLSKTFA